MDQLYSCSYLSQSTRSFLYGKLFCLKTLFIFWSYSYMGDELRWVFFGHSIHFSGLFIDDHHVWFTDCPGLEINTCITLNITNLSSNVILSLMIWNKKKLFLHIFFYREHPMLPMTSWHFQKYWIWRVPIPHQRGKMDSRYNFSICQLLNWIMKWSLCNKFW